MPADVCVTFLLDLREFARHTRSRARCPAWAAGLPMVPKRCRRTPAPQFQNCSATPCPAGFLVFRWNHRREKYSGPTLSKSMGALDSASGTSAQPPMPSGYESVPRKLGSRRGVRVESCRRSIPGLAISYGLENLLVRHHVPSVILIVRIKRFRREAPLLVLHKPMKEALQLVVGGVLC